MTASFWKCLREDDDRVCYSPNWPVADLGDQIDEILTLADNSRDVGVERLNRQRALFEVCNMIFQPPP